MRNVNDDEMEIFSLVNMNVKHLTLTVSTVNQMQMIIRRLKHLSSINFRYINNSCSSEMHIA